MARIVVIGGTGYAGRFIVQEAVSRGHEVVALSRSEAQDPVAGATYVQGSIVELDAVADVLTGADAVISSLSPRAGMENQVIDAVRALVAHLDGTGTRLGVVGGAGGSLIAPGGPRVIDGDFPDEYRHEAQVAIDTLEMLQQSTADLDWFFVHPPEVFGPWAVGERTGKYRDGGDVVVHAEDGSSTISGADFAVAMIDEVEQPKHHRERFTVGY